MYILYRDHCRQVLVRRSVDWFESLTIIELSLHGQGHEPQENS